MISFVSTYPPAMCGIGTYTKYVTDAMPSDSWEVLAFKPDEFSLCKGEVSDERDRRIRYWISLESPSLPERIRGDVVWFQHSFGMWGRVNTHFIHLIEQAKRMGKKVGASFHTIHFQSEETPWGTARNEYTLLEEALPLLDFITVFSAGARRAVIKAFPHYSDKVVVLRHGVHRYPEVGKFRAREKLFDYLMGQGSIPPFERERLNGLRESLFSGRIILIGNYGFITQDKDPVQLYELGMMLQEKLREFKVVTLFVGRIQKRKDKKEELYLPIVSALKSIHNGVDNLFYEDYIPESIFPFAFEALDVAVFWCNNATQSGRMAHAQGTSVSIAGRSWEGIGETLRLSGWPAADTLDELSDIIAEMVRNPELTGKMLRSSRIYAERYSFYSQARKHIELAEAVSKGTSLPILDGDDGYDLYSGKARSRGFTGFEESPRGFEVSSQCC